MKVVIGLDRRTVGSDGQDTTNFGSTPNVPFMREQVEAPGDLIEFHSFDRKGGGARDSRHRCPVSPSIQYNSLEIPPADRG